MHASTARMGLGLLVLTVIGAGLVIWQSSETRDAVVVSPAMPTGNPVAFARSLHDTQPDGDLSALQASGAAGASGALAYGELRRLFDYYLGTVGEQTIEAITAHIRGELQRNLSPAHAQKAQRLLALYIEFKRELVELDGKPELAGGGVATIRRRMLAMQDLRGRYFSQEEVQGMFGHEDDYDMDAVARLEISQDPTLSEAEKQRRLAALDASLPAHLRAERDATHVVVRVEQEAQALRAKGASEDDVYRMRAKAFDPQAAARLAEVDRDEAVWKSRIAHYLNERARLLGALTSEAERQASVGQLQQSLFSAAERPRLMAYE